ncbi:MULTISPECIES: ParB family protein [unclassified Pseudomonas]|uniref:ParB family protein n=1 Tax=unclassified Pseudomonas TaxID=196821 RepID=UPI000C86DB31|nr:MULTISPECIES: ParB family protein [unclassified Pseudomonas]PMV22831.1 hypothetical protein C1X17_13690 [Pseudomonas sp. FW305-3-2-15-C-TSA2]PMV29493.1 hypothetical protein C1X22_11260 [Pseudomonas sp. DP16D-L5]PMV39396.1 hypothetical protein C1X21_11375 [Pseudomonas sp. FW305-3-2-15-A-LB2]PMV45706.1 hypothetical protein C1X16_12905 [Pseudomonas sp. FW305-3-2-15-C-R2A1]PMV52067.1 hypothetical protein C1X18_12045 [Pseudomonas sp. FW305-3-2-15-C-LB1]
MAEQLQVPGFSPAQAPEAALSDPVADTPMVVTLEQLRPYELDPRVTRNPRYGELKESIRERGLDAPPSITRRQDEAFFIIRNGGNTRLAILWELWRETQEERYFRIPCLFRPWPVRGEIVALTGHLAESELHSRLTFIERALGIEKSRELYEQELARRITQSDLARLLSADGYPIAQSHISRMQDAVQFLLPAIPKILYGGLGRHQVERLATLRRAAERTWDQHRSGKTDTLVFSDVFQDALAPFDNQPEQYSFPRLQDELIGQMAEHLGVDYNTLALDISIVGSRQLALTRMPETTESTAPTLPLPGSPPQQPQKPVVIERLAAIQKMVAEQNEPAGEPLSLPVNTDSLYPINDLWRIEPSLDVPHRLRIHIAQFAREIAGSIGQENDLQAVDHSYGFQCSADATLVSSNTLKLLHAMVTPGISVELHTLLIQSGTAEGLDDDSLIKLFRLIRLARRLHQVEHFA